MRVLIIMFSLMLFIAQNSASADQEQKGMMKGKGGSFKEEIFEQLNLTAEQKQKLADHRSGFRSEGKAFGEQMRTKHQQLHELLKQPTLDMGQINALKLEMQQLNDQKLNKRISGIIEVREILGVENYIKFSEIMDEHKQERKLRKKDWHKKQE